jgi:hypothetical protein
MKEIKIDEVQSPLYRRLNRENYCEFKREREKYDFLSDHWSETASRLVQFAVPLRTQLDEILFHR